MKLPASEINKIIIFRALQLGDLLCSIPAIRALRHAYPKAEITLAGLPWANSLPERFPEYFDKFIWFPGYPGLPEQEVNRSAFVDFLIEVQKQKFDLALQMQGNGSVINPMVELFGAKSTAGFYKQDHYFPSNGLFLEYPMNGSEIERHLSLISFLGITSQGTELEFPLTSQDKMDFEAADLRLLPSQYVCIHPGSRGSWRQWPTAYFAKLADYVIEQGFEAVITGTKDELSIVSEVAHQMNRAPIIAAGKTTLGAIGFLIKNSFALISNCTGVSHMASAFKTPSIVISMDGEPERWAPLDRKLHRVFDWTVNPNFDQVFDGTQQLFQQHNDHVVVKG